MEQPQISCMQKFKNTVLSPLTLFYCAVAGVLCGLFMPKVTEATNIIGDLYLAFLGLISVPFLFSALVTSIATLLQNRTERKSTVSLGKMVLVICICFVGIGLLFHGVGLGFVNVCPTGMNVEHLDELIQRKSHQLEAVSVRYYHLAPTSTTSQKTTGAFSFEKFFQDSIPRNFFQSFVENNVLHILLFTILIGIALGGLPGHLSQPVMVVLDATYHICTSFVTWSTYFMPLCVFSLMARTVSMLDFSAMMMVFAFVATVVLFWVLLAVLGLWVWSRSAGISLLRLLRDEGQMLLLSFCTGQRLAVMPMLVQDMKFKQHFPEDKLNAVMPFNFSLASFSITTAYMFMLTVMAHLYGIDITLESLVLICVLTPLMAVGSVYPLGLTVLAKILNLPDELALLMLLSIDPIISPVGTVFNVVSACALSAWSLRKEPRDKQD